MDSPSPAIEAEHLSKFYGQVLGLNDLSLTVGKGEVRGLLGQNGSGKSTLLKSLLGLIHPSSGWVRGLGYEEKKERIPRLIESLDLEGRQGETITGYSQGMKQKVAIMGAILHHPKILLMDEPLNGLDPKSARVVKELIHSL